MRLASIGAVLALLASCPGPVRADYIVLRSGQRLMVTSYQLAGGTYHLRMQGGTADVPASEVVRVDPQDVFEPVASPVNTQTPYHELIQAAATRYSVDAELVSSVIAVESNFEPRAVSRRNARGLMQLLPDTAAKLGVHDVFDPKENIEAGTRYLSELLRQYDNNLALALAAYNAGPQRVKQFGRRVPPYAETVSYVKRVRELYRSRKTGATNAVAKQNRRASEKNNPSKLHRAIPES